jgi:predicted SAM-dependent methyltransferase
MLGRKTKIELGVYNHPHHDHKEWIYQDILPLLGVDLVCDAKRLDEIESESMDEVYASHLAEHFYYAELGDVLKEWVRILKPHGILTVVVPDFVKIAEILVKSDYDEDIRVRFGVENKTDWIMKMLHNEPEKPHAHRNHYPYYVYDRILKDLGCDVIVDRRHSWQVPEAVIVATKR